MSKEQHSDTISAKMWKAYFSGVILTSEKERVEAFLKKHPEFEAEFRSLSSDDMSAVSRITKKVNIKINAKMGKKSNPLYLVGMGVVVLAIVVFVFNYQDKQNTTIVENDNGKESEIYGDTIVEQIVIIEEDLIDDTLFSFERKGNNIAVAEVVNNEFIEEEIIPEHIPTDDLVMEEEIVKEVVVKKTYEKSFLSTINYRQTIHVEDNFYSQSKTMGKTTSYASPIKGYSYEQEGMPNFRGSDEELLSYINTELESDELLTGIKKKMKANLSFVVTNKGKIKDVLVQNCNNKQIGLSLMQIMENMPDWNPSEYKGKKGKVHYVLKIVFQ